jgi:hypothetical protein
MNTLNNNQINNILKNYNLFDTTIMSDEGNKLKNNKYYVINLNSSKQKGSHWCALYYNNNKSIYFDSYGFYPDKEIEKYLNSYDYNDKQIQDLYSSSCGYYCIAFIIYMIHNNNNLKGFIDMFNDNFKLNEKILYNYLKKYNIVY